MSISFEDFEKEFASDEPEKRTEAEIHQSELVSVLVQELSLIARDIEDVPIATEELTRDQIVALQKIDFCRQRLIEVAKIMQNAFGDATPSSLHDLEEILTDVGLEHTLAAFRKQG